jgi:predicted ATP-grasp superfamily ATP-dependent carboligase
MGPSLIVPCDDAALAVLHEHHARFRDDPRARSRVELIERSLGDPAQFETVRKKSRLMALAEAAGIAVPAGRILRDADDLNAQLSAGPWPKVLKADGWSGGRGTYVVENAAQGAAAYVTALRALGTLTMVKDAVRDGAIMPLYRRALMGEASMSLQAFVPGLDVNRAVVCWKGEVIAGRTFEAVETFANNGMATVVKVRDIPSVEDAARRCAALLGLSGIAGFDFKYDEASGSCRLLEVNHRVTAGAYVAAGDAPPLVQALADLLRDAPASQAPTHPAAGTLITLFPQEYERDPNSPYLRRPDYRAPGHEPAFVAACLRRARHVPLLRRVKNRVKAMVGSVKRRA